LRFKRREALCTVGFLAWSKIWVLDPSNHEAGLFYINKNIRRVTNILRHCTEAQQKIPSEVTVRPIARPSSEIERAVPGSKVSEGLVTSPGATSRQCCTTPEIHVDGFKQPRLRFYQATTVAIPTICACEPYTAQKETFPTT